MPDCHAGIGAVIGFTMKMNNYIIPNIIGVDIGCFTEDTKVELTDGRQLSFLKLIEEYNKGINNYCYSIDKNSNVVIGKIENPRKVKDVGILYEIKLDNGKIIKCTDDHIFYTRDNKETEAKNLKIGDALMPLYLDIAKNILFEEKSYKNKKNKLEDYKVVYNSNTREYDYVHFLADDYNINMKLDYQKNGTVRHHKDFNKLNNNPSNVKRVKWKEHWRIHSDAVSYTNKKGITGFEKARKLHPEFFSKMASENMKKLHQDKNFQKRRNKRAIENFRKYNNSEKAKEDWKKAGKRGSKYLINLNKNYNIIFIASRIKKVLLDCLNKYDIITEEYYEIERKKYYNYPRYFKIKEILNILKLNNIDEFIKIDNFYNYMKNNNIKNHKIISIKIKKGLFPVYCLEVPKYHNFALSSGVFVHNCGMLTAKFHNVKNIDLKELDNYIKRQIPYGFNINSNYDKNRTFNYDVELICKEINIDTKKSLKAIGSLGGGNHFIEGGYDKENNFWIIIHSGSRNFGKCVADFYQRKAKEQLEKYFVKDQYRNLEFLHIDDKYARDYLYALKIAQKFAELNRREMLDRISLFLNEESIDVIQSVHNFIGKDNIIRKGATSAKENELLIIPFNMRDGIAICRGKGSKKYNFSVPHGAGRILSRKQAKLKLSEEIFKQQMNEANIFTTTANINTLDESPDAYKDKNIIIENIKETVDIIEFIKPIYNFKAETK